MPKILIVLVSLSILLCLPVNPAAAQKAQKTITSYTYDKNIGVTRPGSGVEPAAGDTSTSTTITDPQTSSDFPPVENTDDAISVNPASGTITLINEETETSGSIWYGGSSSSATVCNACTNGVCPFGIGFRAYFEFRTLQDMSARSDAIISNGVAGPGGDGFTFTVMNASQNTIEDRGGIPMNNGTPIFSMGSLLGYAGPGNTANKLGIRPPKFAIEFDMYPNNTSNNICNGGRYDNAGSYDVYGSSGNTSNHVALMYWGVDPSSTTMCSYGTTAGTSYPQASMDDNYHGAGAGTTTNPYNSSLSGNGSNASGAYGYYERSRANNGGTYNWLEDGGWHRARIEVLRDPSAYTYRVKVWIDCELCTSYPCPFTSAASTACPAAEYVYFQNIYSPYTNASYLPKLDRTVTLSSTLNSMFNNILFGFTEGSGAVTQTIEITNFAIYFPTSNIAPTAATHTYSAQTGNFSVTTAAGTCVWRTHSNASWIMVTDDNIDRTGSGTVTYTISANPGAARTGTISVGSQIFTVTQAAGPPSCTLTAGSNIVAYSSTNILTWTVTGTATNASWITSPGGTCGNPSVSGGSCTTAAQTAAGAKTYTLNVSNANGSSTCATTFYVGCQGYTVYNNTGSRRDFRITGSSCSRTNNGSAVSGTLSPGETVTRYNTNNRSCGSAQGSFGYVDAMNVDIIVNDGDGDCQVNYNVNDTAGDR